MLQLAVTDAKKVHNIDELLAKGHAIVCYYCYSTVARERLHKCQCQLEKPQQELLPMVATRWNSEYVMLSRLVEQQAPVSADLGASLTVDCFTTKEWKQAAEIVNVLIKPIEEATRELCHENIPTLPTKIPLLNGIEYVINSHIKEMQDKNGVFFCKVPTESCKVSFSFVSQC
ncbi:hypothetical protein PR048_002960 [Dryococelus australis]|uniref:Uncharacterized protein n=1 Tax=Dryococelus australis TaxID=614101 RepID=A0ABQ9ILR5_9NEOP|nr:hypothetical protein PR048_002960 [Dryococelus australis]